MDTETFPGVKRPRRGVDNQTPSKAEDTEIVVIPILSLWAFLVCSKVNFTYNILL
jgi:hypothetical protein